MRPLSFIAEAIFVDIDNSLSSFSSHLGKLLGTVSKLIESSRSVPIDDHIDIFKKLLKQLPSFWRFQVNVGGMLAHVPVDLEKWYVAEIWARDFDDVGTVLAKDSSNDWAGDNAAELQHFDA